jgi:hypothetical protein
MLTGKSLTEARSEIQLTNDGDYRTYPSDLRRALANSSIRLGRKVDCSSWDSILNRSVQALVAVRHTVTPNGLDRWHWLLFDGTCSSPRLLDPERGIRTDFGRIRLKWYHLVTPDGPKNSIKPKHLRGRPDWRVPMSASRR